MKLANCVFGLSGALQALCLNVSSVIAASTNSIPIFNFTFDVFFNCIHMGNFSHAFVVISISLPA
jgi:hypothetical protein